MKKSKNIVVIYIMVLFGAIFTIRAQSRGNSFPEMYNIAWDSQSKDASASMPVGGGDTGCNVWVEDNQLLFYIQRSGVHDEFNGFPKLGRVRFWTAPNIFDGALSFHQELKLKDGSIEITAKHAEHGDIKIKIWVEVHRPVIHVESISGKKLTYFTQYDSWRTEPRTLDPKSRTGERFGWWDIEGWENEVILEEDHFKQDDDSFTAYHVNPTEKLSSKLAYENMGLGEQYGKYPDPLKDLVWGTKLTGSNLIFDNKVTGDYASTPYTGWRYKSKIAVKKQKLAIMMHTSNCGSASKWFEELDEKQNLADEDTKTVWAKNKKWWSDFWKRSHLILTTNKQQERDSVWHMGRNYNLFRYMTACNAYGANPTKFNGGLFTFDPRLGKGGPSYHPDWRRWGGGNYTLQNQRWVYWPMLKWGDAEHMIPQFDFFSKTLGVAEMRVKENYGHDGCMYDEPATVYGLPFPMNYGFKSSNLNYRQRAKWDDPGQTRSVAVRNSRIATLEFSYMILEYYRYTGKDISKWLPFINSTLDFYDQHYRMRSKYFRGSEYDMDGKLVLFPAMVCEGYVFSTDPTPDIYGLHAVVNSVKTLPEEWINEFFGDIDDIERINKSIPDFNYDTVEGDIVIPPARNTVYSNFHSNNEIYLNYPMFPFNQIKLGDKEMDYIHNTYKHYATWMPKKQKVVNWDVYVSWTYANVAFARMGIAEKAAGLAQKKLENGDYRFPAFWGPGYDGEPDHNWGGTASVGIQEMLMQVTDDKIVLLPAWPKDWNAKFKFHAPKNTTIEGEVINGEISNLKVLPESRSKDIVIWNKQ